MIILKSGFIILVPKKTGMISRMIDSSRNWLFRSRPGAANPSSHSHPLREPRKLKFFSTFSENTSSHHHPSPIKHQSPIPIIIPIESCPDIRKLMHGRWISPWASTPRIILPSSFPIRVSKLPSHHHPNQIRPWEKKII